MGGSIDRSTLGAFAGIVLFGGLNAVAIKFSNQELAPFWGATLRFALAAALLFAVVAYRRIALPRGRALIGSLLYGILGFGVAYALAYWALIETPAGLAMVILALVPLLTLLLAVVHGLEKFRLQSAAGSLVAVAGIAFIFGSSMGGATAVPLLSLLAVVVGAFVLAETNVVVKLFPRSHPVATNAVAMSVGAVMLLATSLVAGEPLVLPQQAASLAAVGYLVVIGSIGLFMLFLYVIERWTASATSYTLLLMPLVAVPGAALLVDEPMTPALLAGGAFVLGGVYVGAFAPSVSRPFPGLRRRRAAEEEATALGPPALETPNCP